MSYLRNILLSLAVFYIGQGMLDTYAAGYLAGVLSVCVNFLVNAAWGE